MEMYYIGLDIHKKTIAFCTKKAGGGVVEAGNIAANRGALTGWATVMKHPWIGGMEATMFTGWVYDLLKPYSYKLLVGHPFMMKAITASKRKSDSIDAATIADLLRAELFPECYMAPREIRHLRTLMRYRNKIVRETVRMKNKISGLLMETGSEYEGRRLHGKKYFAQLVESLDDVPELFVEMLGLTRGVVDLLNAIHKRVMGLLLEDPLLRDRVELLKSIDGVGDVTALSWAVEIADPSRFSSVKKAASYCGLTSAHKSSGGKESRGPISKMRNKHIQPALIEAAKLAPIHNEYLKDVYEREKIRGNSNRATLAVARKLVAFLLYVDRTGEPFTNRTVTVAGE